MEKRRGKGKISGKGDRKGDREGKCVIGKRGGGRGEEKGSRKSGNLYLSNTPPR